VNKLVRTNRSGGRLLQRFGRCRHENRNAVGGWHDLRGLPDHRQESARQGQWR
jgi:hypothetical protein